MSDLCERCGPRKKDAPCVLCAPCAPCVLLENRTTMSVSDQIRLYGYAVTEKIFRK